MNELNLTQGYIFSVLESGDRFPVDFDDAWRWIGYARKDSAKRALSDAGFVGGVDFQVLHNVVESDNHAGFSPQEVAAASRRESIRLTIDCFKSFAMMAGTSRGREVRQYFLNCETELKRIVEQRSQARQFDPEIERLKLQNEGWRLQNEHLRLQIQREQEASAKSTLKAKAKIYDFPKRGSAAAPPVDKNGLTREMLKVVEICRKNGWCTARVICQGTRLVKSSDHARDIFRELKVMEIGELRQSGKRIEFRVKQEWLDAHPAAEVSESLEKLQQLCFHS